MSAGLLKLGMLQKITKYLLLAVLFLLPWQTRFIYEPAFINGAPWEYGTKSVYGIELLLGLLIVCAFGSLFRQKARIVTRQKSFWFFAVLVLGFLGLEIFLSTNPGISYQFLTRLIAGVCLAVLIKQSAVPRLKLLAALWLGGVVQGIVALMQFFTQQVAANKWLGMASHTAKELGASVIEFGDERWLRAYGSFGSPNSLGIYLAVVLIVGLVVYLAVQKPAIKLAITIGQLVVLSGLIITFSRGAWIACCAGIIFFAYAVWRTPERTDFIKQIVWYALVSIFFISILRPLFLARATPANRLESRSITERQAQLVESAGIFFAHPFKGVGPGAYTALLTRLHPEATAYELQPVHNIYLLFLAEWGILVSIILFFGYGYLAIRVLKSRDSVGAVIVVLVVAGLFDHWLYSLLSGQLLWFIGLGFIFKPLVLEVKYPLDSTSK